jgi:hypothetical protein
MLDRGERICLHCTLNEVEDESHMLFKCPIYEPERATLLAYIQDNCKNFDSKLWQFIANIMIYIVHKNIYYTNII